MPNPTNTPGRPTESGWRVHEWAADAGVPRSYTYLLLQAGTIDSVKIGTMRIIRTSPADFLAAQSDER